MFLWSFFVEVAGKSPSHTFWLQLRESNYDDAIAMLKERFGREHLVVSSHVTKLLNLTPVQKSSDIVALRHLYEWDIQIWSLESLGVVSDKYRGLLCPILLQMIPDDLAPVYICQTVLGHELEI